MRKLYFLTVSLAFILISFITQLMVLTATRLAYPTEGSDPFASYEAIMPGQPMTASPHYSCDNEEKRGIGNDLTCNMNPTGSPLLIGATAHVHNGRFQQIWFRTAGLYIGDIVRHWGRPNFIVNYDRVFYVRWDNQGLYALIEPSGRMRPFNYLLPVRWLTVGLQHNGLGQDNNVNDLARATAWVRLVTCSLPKISLTTT